LFLIFPFLDLPKQFTISPASDCERAVLIATDTNVAKMFSVRLNLPLVALALVFSVFSSHGFAPTPGWNLLGRGRPECDWTRSVARASTELRAAKTAVIAGATGYIGKSVVREAVRQGYRTIALVRDAAKLETDEGQRRFGEFFEGAEIVECDVSNRDELTRAFKMIQNSSSRQKIDAIVSCLASRSGVKKESFLIDYQATLNCLQAARVCEAGHFVLLSAFCVRKPVLQFQKAKLQFEAALRSQNDVPYTVVRPTAFFKSVSGQLESVQSGKPFIIFGKRGAVTRCNPIAEAELAQYLMDSIMCPERRNRIVNLGGPDDPLTKMAQGNMMFEATGMEPKFFYVPELVLNTIIGVSQFLSNLTGSEACEDAAEIGRISKYYAVEDMLTTEDEEKFGTITLKDHFKRISVEGQEYDPYVTVGALTSELVKMERN
jgi:divinyl chlorophyllide a 8-vinyl-reductase